MENAVTIETVVAIFFVFVIVFYFEWLFRKD